MENVTVDELIFAFLAGETDMHTWTKKKPGPLRIEGNKIISFKTVICERYGDKYIINPKFYSRQTEIAQKILLRRIPSNKQVLADGVPFVYLGSLVEYI